MTEQKKPAQGRTWYVCDPVKNTECRKRGCVHNPEAECWHCWKTSNPAFAVLDKSEAPMIAAKELKLPIYRDRTRLDQLSYGTDHP